MKKRIAFVLAMSMLLSFTMTACGETDSSAGKSTPSSDSEEAYEFTENMTFVVPYKAGGGVDVAVRALLEAGLKDQLGVSVTVENVEGGNTLIGAQQVLGAEPDGNTVFFNTCAAFLAAPQMYGNPYQLEDWQYITTLGMTELYLAAGPSAPASTVEELIEFGKSGQEVSVGCAGYGDISALAAYITLNALGVKCQLIPYSGAAESTAACLGGHVEYVCATDSSIASHCEEGTLTALYETGSIDDNTLGVPSITSLGYADASTPYYRIVAVTKDVPANVVEALRKAFKTVLEDPDCLEKLAASKQIIRDVVNDPDELQKLLQKDYQAYGEMVKTLNLQG